MIELVSLSISGCEDILLRVNLYFALLILFIILSGLILKYNWHCWKWGYCEIDGVELGIGTSKIKIKTNQEDIQIAYKLWVELSTRKIGLPIDYNNDVIIEIYKSWYEFFGITRELIKSIPATKVCQCDSTKKLVTIAILVLNSCLREHLTLWQAKFRHWYENELNKDDNKETIPQELQKKYPQYDELVESMKEVNDKLINYRTMLRNIVFGEEQ